MRFYSKSDLALESEYFSEPDPKPQPPKFFQASHSASTSIGAELKSQKNTGHAISSNGVKRLPLQAAPHWVWHKGCEQTCAKIPKRSEILEDLGSSHFPLGS